MHRIVETISDLASPMALFLMIAAGILGRYWDGPIFAYKGQDADAAVARGVGLGLLIAAVALYALKLGGRFFGSSGGSWGGH